MTHYGLIQRQLNLYQQIANSPGLSVKDLCNKTGLPTWTVVRDLASMSDLKVSQDGHKLYPFRNGIMNDVIDFLIQAFHPPTPEKPNLLPENALCALTGNLIEYGYPVKTIITNTSADIPDTFRYISDFVSVPAARCYKASGLLRGNLLALNRTGLRPFVSQDSSTNERPSWRSVIFNKLTSGTQTVAIFTDESKRRLWPNARLSIFGEYWQPYLNASPWPGSAPVSRLLTVNASHVRKCLRLVEEIYSIGFSKPAIAIGLLHPSNRKKIQAIGITQAKEYENQISLWRDKDEFLLSIFVAQKMEDIEQCQQSKLISAEQKSLQPELF